MSTVRIRSIRRIRVQTIVNQSWKEIHARTIPNPPGSPRAGRALTNQFSQKILREPRECATLVLTTAIRAPGPAATRHFATNEDSLPILPMYPNHAERTAALPAQPCRIRPLSALHKGPSFRTSQIVWDRLGSSGIVWDRLGSSGIVRARRCPPPGIPAEMPRYSPDSARQTGKKSASKRVISRRNAAKYTRKR